MTPRTREGYLHDIDPLAMNHRRFGFFAFYIPFIASVSQALAQQAPVQNGTTQQPEIPTPPGPHTPAIHGPKIYGIRPGTPFLYSIPATGDRPMQFSVDNLPHGLNVDGETGQITGQLVETGNYQTTVHAKKPLGAAQRNLTIISGSEIGLTPAMGWNSFNTYGVKVNEQQILEAAHAMAESGLAQHGWTYINTDDGWQGTRGGPLFLVCNAE